MPQFKLHRDYLLRTTKGFTIKFTKGEETFVPAVCVPDAVAIGAQQTDGHTDVLGDDKVEPLLTSEQRKEKIIDAYTKMVTRNERLDFTAHNTPNLKRLAYIVGFDVSSKERDDTWQEFKINMNGG